MKENSDNKKIVNKKIRHAKDPRCFDENEDYYLNRRIVKSKTEGMVYYYQKVEGAIVKTEVTVHQWKQLYNYNRKMLRSSRKYYDEDYWRRFSVFTDEDGEEDDPLEHYSDFDSRFCEMDNIERIDREMLLSKMTKLGRTLYKLYYVNENTQGEIASILQIKQYQVSRLLRQLDEVIEKEFLDDGERTQTDIQVEYIYNRYRKIGKLDNFEDVVFEDFLSNLKSWEYERLCKWFYSEKELYRYGIKFLIRYKLKDYTNTNIYRELFTLKDLQVRGYFMSEITHLPHEYQWLFLYLEKQIERRSERFAYPKETKHDTFIRLLKRISSKAGMSPQKYYETKFLPYYQARIVQKQKEFAIKELGVYYVKDNDIQAIATHIKKLIAKLPAKERKRWEGSR